MQGLDELRKSVAAWPKDAPHLRGMPIFQFNEAGLIRCYEDFFDPGWMPLRHRPEADVWASGERPVHCRASKVVEPKLLWGLQPMQTGG